MPDIAFADSETRSLIDLTVVGAYKYARHPSTDASIWGYVFDDEPVGHIWSPDWAWGNANGTRADHWEPTALLDHIENGGYFVAWNANFDRQIWNEVMVKKYDWPYLHLKQVLCAQAQAEANNLPGKMAKACETLGTKHKKDPQGQRLIGILCTGTRADWHSEIYETPEKMGHFRSYCLGDCLSMREVWQHTRPLTLVEWEQYHASETINDRGVQIDIDFAVAAQGYAAAEFKDLNADMFDLTDDPKLTVTNHIRKARWLYDQLWPDEELQLSVERPEKDGKRRFSADRATRELVLDMLSQPDHSDLFETEHLNDVIEFLEIIEAGNSAAVRKFTAMVNMEYDGRVHGQYSFNGAGQTGRYSSRGIQVHNMIRDPVEKGNADRAIDAVEDIMAERDVDYLFDEYGFPISRLLARLIRPTFVAAEGKTLVWGDWDQIEARVLPWLADSDLADRKLDLFRQKLDVYKYAAVPIFNLARPEDATDEQRQVGKVSELALGFGGAVGAFTAMGRGYGVILEKNKVQAIVNAWRATNRWAVAFWSELWEAAISAFNAPGVWYTAGKVKYLYHPALMHGTLICELPSGRWLVYPQFRHEHTTWTDKKTDEERTGWRTTFMKGFGSGAGRVDLWYGVLAENVTQATAADFLRDVIVELRDILVLHTHDEVVAEVWLKDLAKTIALMEAEMTWLPEWAEGLPLSVSIEHGPFYTK